MILAAGQGTRMKSRLAKMLHPVAGRPMLGAVLDAARGCSPTQTVVVVGHSADQIREYLAQRPEPIEIALQERQLGTGHAVSAALPALDATAYDVMVLFGD